MGPFGYEDHFPSIDFQIKGLTVGIASYILDGLLYGWENIFVVYGNGDSKVKTVVEILRW